MACSGRGVVAVMNIQVLAERELKIESEVKEIKRAFFCSLCSKQYKLAVEFEAHLSSYDHNHRKVLLSSLYIYYHQHFSSSPSCLLPLPSSASCLWPSCLSSSLLSLFHHICHHQCYGRLHHYHGRHHGVFHYHEYHHHLHILLQGLTF